MADTGLPCIGESERVAGAGSADAACHVVGRVLHSLDAGDVRVVLGKVGEVEAIAPHGVGRHREACRRDGGRRCIGGGGRHGAKCAPL